MGKNGEAVLMALPVKDAIPTPDNPRTVDTKCEEFQLLLESVKVDGVKVPVVARPHPKKKGKYDLRAGARRLAAAKAAKRPEIPAIVYTKMDDKAAFDITFLENYARADLAPIEQGRAVEILMTKYDNDVKAVASKLGWTERGVRMCAKLKDLSAEWRKALAESSVLGIDLLTAAHLALVARLPEKTQDAVLREYDFSDGFVDWNANQTRPVTLKALRELIAAMVGDLKGAPWDAADAALVPAAGACADCTKRSDADAQRGLWDEELSAAMGKGACLDLECWKAKHAAYLKRQYAELKKEHKSLKCVATDYIRGDDAEVFKKAYGSVQDVQYGYTISKKPAKGATPCLIVHGKGAGSVGYMKKADSKYSSTRVAAASGTGKAPGTPTPLNVRRKALESKRWHQAIMELQERVRDYGPEVSWSEDAVIKLAAVFGTIDNDTCAGKAAWDEYANSSPAAAREHLQDQVLQVLTLRITVTGIGVTQLRDSYVTEARHVAHLLGIDLDAIYRDVCTRKGFTEPKSWANLKADGTPKTAPKKKTTPKKKAAKKKAAKSTTKKKGGK